MAGASPKGRATLPGAGRVPTAFLKFRPMSRQAWISAGLPPTAQGKRGLPQPSAKQRQAGNTRVYGSRGQPQPRSRTAPRHVKGIRRMPTAKIPALSAMPASGSLRRPARFRLRAAHGTARARILPPPPPGLAALPRNAGGFAPCGWTANPSQWPPRQARQRLFEGVSLGYAQNDAPQHMQGASSSACPLAGECPFTRFYPSYRLPAWRKCF